MDAIRVECKGGVGVLTLDRPERAQRLPDRERRGDARGIELGFWTTSVWAQADSPMFTRAENTNFPTTAACAPSDCVEGMQPKGLSDSTMWQRFLWK